MKTYRILSWIAIALLTTSCGNNAKECDPMLDQDICSTDNTAILKCVDGKWTTTACQSPNTCGYTQKGPVCTQNQISCTPGTATCTPAGLLQKCNENGQWEYQACNGQCLDGVCTQKETTDTPILPPTMTGIIKLQCSNDKKSIEFVDHEGNITSQTCRDAVGFDATCKVYSNGLAGCALPDACDDTFSQNGTCLGDKRLWCDTQYIIPKPSVQDCTVLGTSCSVLNNKAECRMPCDPATPLTCTIINNVEYAAQCTQNGSQYLTETAVHLCTSDKESVTCLNGEIVKTTCEQGTNCIPELGKCTESCTADKLGDFKCATNGELLTCATYADGYAYTSLGMRHCNGNTRISCEKQADDSYAKTEIDCTNYTDNNGNNVSGTCVTELQFYPDMDVCYFDPDSEGRCNNLNDAGICNGQTLKYCDESSDNAYTVNCALNQTNSQCSVFAGYADCRKPCTQAKKSTCTSTGESYLLSICAPDDATGNLTEIEGQSVCIGNELHTCDENGIPKIINCEANGGICQTNACVYPACTTSPICLADDAIHACQVQEDGNVIGASLETTWCLPNGTCKICSASQITNI